MFHINSEYNSGLRSMHHISQRKYIKDKVSFRIQSGKVRLIGSDLRSEVHTPHFTEERIDGLSESFQPLRVQP
jgi:hypothetical protein